MSSGPESAKGSDDQPRSATRGGAGTDPTPASRDDARTGLAQDPEPTNPAQDAAANAPGFMKGTPGNPPQIFAALDGLRQGSFAPKANE